jgi:cytochrome b561
MTTTAPPPGRQDHVSQILGWLIAFTFFALWYNTILMPRTPLDAREGLRAVHYTLGFSVMVLVALRLYWWAKAPRPSPPPGLPVDAFAFSRAILLALLFTFATTGLIGFGYAWSDGQHVSLFAIPVPALGPESSSLRATTGYFHSALGFYYIGLLILWLVVGVYQHWRYGCGLMRLFPGSRV